MRYNLWFSLAGLALLAIAGCSGESAIDLAKLPPPVNAVMQASPGEPTQVAAADALARIGQPAVLSLTEALVESDPTVRLQACKALAYMGAKASPAVPALIQRVSDRKEEDAVRIQAANALGQIGDAAQPAVPQLIQMLRDGK